MSRCGSCPVYGRGAFGIHCSGDYGVEECADTLQELYYATVNALQSSQSCAQSKETREMRAWDVVITETLTRTVSVEAESCGAAEALVKAMYDREEIVLGAEDHSNTEIAAEQEGVCPLCGAEIEYNGCNNIDDDGGAFPWVCPSCGAHGEEGYSRRFSGHVNVEMEG